MIHGRTIGKHIALLYLITLLDDRVLGNVRVFVRALELGELVGLQLGFGLQHNAGRINLHDLTIFRGHNGARGIMSDLIFDAGSNPRCLRFYRRHSLPLHVRSHERAVRRVMFQKRNECGCRGNGLVV